MKEALQFSNRRKFREWLEKNGAENEGVWLLFGKKGGPATLSANDALEEALCHGWIDGQMQKIDDLRYRKYFARRLKSSNWSEKNKKLAQQLIDKGLMREPGMQCIERAKQNGAWSKSERFVPSDKNVEEFKGLLRDHAVAYGNYLSMSPSVQKTYAGWYLDAKLENTRKTRLLKIVDRLNKNLKPM